MPQTIWGNIMRRLVLFTFLCSSLIGVMGCSGQPADPTLVVNRNIMLIPSTAPGYRAEPDAPLLVVCGKQDPRNPQMEARWGGETSPRCWYGRPVSPTAPPAPSTP